MEEEAKLEFTSNWRREDDSIATTQRGIHPAGIKADVLSWKGRYVLHPPSGKEPKFSVSLCELFGRTRCALISAYASASVLNWKFADSWCWPSSPAIAQSASRRTLLSLLLRLRAGYVQRLETIRLSSLSDLKKRMAGVRESTISSYCE